MRTELGASKIVALIEYALKMSEASPFRLKEDEKFQIELDRRTTTAIIRTGMHIKAPVVSVPVLEVAKKLFEVKCPNCKKVWHSSDRRRTICSDKCREESRKKTMKRANRRRDDE